MANNDERRGGKPEQGSGRQRKVRAEGERPEQMIGENRTDGPSYISDVDRMAMSGEKTEWQERTAPAAGDPVSEEELEGLSILGGSDVREGAIPGVSDPIRDGSGGPQERPDPDAAIEGAGRGGVARRNPPLVEDSAFEDGGVSMSGGVAGGERGHAGSSDRANPAEEGKSGPAEYKSTSRMDLDRSTDEARG
ncbi:MAG: hypothetical protein ACJ79S_13865 [Gemmatimonadaceae bacterium]